MSDPLFIDLPNPISPVTVGNHVVTYQRHHVIPTYVYAGSDFLKALEARGLWNQNSFATNGVALADTIDDQLASTSPNRDIVGGALHTGGHTNYNSGVGSVISRFDTQYRALIQSGASQADLDAFLGKYRGHKKYRGHNT